MSPFEAARQHAYHCALTECCTTSYSAAQALSCTPDAARIELKNAADAGYFRALLLPGMGNKLLYQPTPKAAGIRGVDIPKFLRAGLAADARRRGLLRGYIRFATHPELSFLPVTENSDLCTRYGVRERGHARALIGLDGTHSNIFVPVLPSEKPAAVIESACFRWFPLLESGTATLHFISENTTVAALRDVIASMVPKAGITSLRDELAVLNEEIAADKTSNAAIQHARKRAALISEIEALSIGNNIEEYEYAWLGDVIGATP